MKRHFLIVVSYLVCLSSFPVVPTTARAQDRAGAEGRDRIRTFLLRPAGWSADWIGPSGDISGKAEWTYEAREDRIVATLRNTFRSDGAHLLTCERSVSIGQDRVTHDGCMDVSIELLFDPKDSDYPFKGTSPRGYRYKLKVK